MNLIKEGMGIIINETPKVVSKEMPVFYNPVMKHNRDLTIFLLKAYFEKLKDNFKLQACDLLAGSGIRSIRLLLESPEIISHITINDGDKESYERIKKNLSLNKISFNEWCLNDLINNSLKREGPGSRDKAIPRVVVTNLDANHLLMLSNGFDYIDVDPFGSPNSFLDFAVKRSSREGIIAITATDTSALAGSYPKACLRKYWANPVNNERKHEAGLRILIRKCQLIGAQYNKALYPVLSYNKDHYYRIFFRVKKSKSRCDFILSQHGFWEQEPEAGPLWIGPNSDPEIISTIIRLVDNSSFNGASSLKKFLRALHSESLLGLSYYFGINELNKKWDSKFSKNDFLKALGSKGCETHHEGNAIRSTLSGPELYHLMKSHK